MQIYHLILNKSQIETTINISDEAIDKAIKHAEEEQGFDYVVEQLDTIHKSLHRTVSLITGKAGTGKTSIMRAIVKAYMENNYMMTFIIMLRSTFTLSPTFSNGSSKNYRSNRIPCNDYS